MFVSLSRNYPNPFNPSTRIPFSVQGSAFVTITIYDVLGREVAILVKEKKDPGEYSVEWDASGMPSGVYCYQVTVAGAAGASFTENRKMVIIR